MWRKYNPVLFFDSESATNISPTPHNQKNLTLIEMDLSKFLCSVLSAVKSLGATRQVPTAPLKTMMVPDKFTGLMACSVIDPLNEETFYLFYHKKNCYYFNNQSKAYFEIESMPIGDRISLGSKCAIFKNPNNDNYYALVIGNCGSIPIQNIFHFKTRKWETVKYENMLAINQIFGTHFAMINDIFNDNIIHIAGGFNGGTNYGYLTFNCAPFSG